MSSQIRTYSELRQQIHHDLRVQHPEWIEPNGESPMCDSYDARLLELLDTLGRQEPRESIAATSSRHRIESRKVKIRPLPFDREALERIVSLVKQSS